MKMVRERKIIICLGTLGILLIVLLTLIISHQQTFDISTLQVKTTSSVQQRLTSQTSQIVAKNRTKRILFYNSNIFLNSKDIYNYNFFQSCPFKNCQMVFNKHEANRSDAVIFLYWVTRQVPKFQRPRGQVWIMNQFEAPPAYAKVPSLPKFKKQFNWTVSYTSKADLWWPYGKIRHRPKEELIQRNYKHIAENKTKDAVWIVSRCQTQSKRLEYVNILRQYISVDILGACGKKWECGMRSNHNDCFDILNTTYRYYLAFENALCEDYITEKVFENFKYDIIQIVRAGSPNLKPLNISNNAYVSTSDYRNAHELGKYLKALSNNTSRYAAMLETKDTYQVVPYIEIFDSVTCEICQRLNNIHDYESVYEDAYQWILTEQQCFQPEDV